MSRTLTSNLKTFIEGLIAEKRALGRKYKSTEVTLYSFDVFCIEKYPNETTLTQEMAMDWATLRPGENMGYLNNRVTAMRQLAKYMWRRGNDVYILPENFTGRSLRYTPHIYTKPELSAFFYVADNLKPRYQPQFFHYVIPVIFRLIYTCGLRPGEALAINVTDVNLKTGEILIQAAKGLKDRIVVLSDDMLELCKKYYVKMRLYFPDTDVFFPNSRGKSYSLIWLEKNFKKIWQKTGIETTGSSPRLYDLRHTFATECLYRFAREGKKLDVWLTYLSSYMGHKNYDATAYYIHLIPAYFSSNDKASEIFNDIVPEVCHEVY